MPRSARELQQENCWDQFSAIQSTLLTGKKKVAIAKLAIYFNCGRDDEYDFEVGAAALDKQLQEAHIKHEFHLYPGNHSASYFGAHIGEVMEFHSKMFGPEK